MNMHYLFKLLFMLIVGYLIEVHALAGTISYSNTTLTFSPSGPYTLGRDKAVGSTLGTANTSITATDVNCAVTETVTITGTELGSASGIYTTSVDGIGVKFYFFDGNNETLITSTQNSRTIASPNSGRLPGIRADLVVTGPVSAGNQLGALPSANVSFEGSCITTQGSFLTINNPGAIKAITCEVTTKDITVNLPTVALSSLNAVGKTSGDTRFNIGLSCPQNSPNNVGVYITLTVATTSGNTTDLLTLTQDSTAFGVKLRLLNSQGTVILFGPDSAIAGNNHQSLVGTVQSTTGILMTVQYVRSEGTLSAGSVKAQATFTMSYQ